MHTGLLVAKLSNYLENEPGRRMVVFIDKKFADYRFPFFLELSRAGIHVTCLESGSKRIIKFCEGSIEELRYNNLNFLIKYVFIIHQRGIQIISGNLGVNTILCVLFARSDSARIFAWCRLTLWSERNRSLGKKLLRRFLLARVDLVLVNGDSGRIYCQDLGALKIETFYQSSVGLDSICSHGQVHIPANPLKLLFAGRLVEIKGLKEFLQAAKDIRTLFTLTIIGDGPLSEELKNQAIEQNISVEFLGKLPRSEVLEVMIRSDALIMPSLGDEWGLVVIEAMSVGLPIIGSTKAGAVEELNSIQEIGATFDPEMPESIKEALEKVINWDQEKWDQYRVDNVSLIKRLEITHEGMAKKLLNLLQTSDL